MGSSTIEDGGNDVQPEGKKKEEKVKVKEETTAITSEDPGGGRCVQVGSHQTMKVTSTSSKPLQIEQYGENNAVSIKIDPKVKNNVRFVLNSEQLSKEDEDAITTDLKEDEGLEILVKSSGCTSLTIKKGSIIIEMDVEPGTNMDKEWLFSLFTLLFEERLRKLFPKGISFDVEVEKTWTVTLEEIESAKKSDLHALCVPKEKYDALFEENTELIGKIKAMEKKVVRRHPMSFPLEQYEELLKENLELSRISNETIFRVYFTSLQRGRSGEPLKEILELSRKMRETIFEDYARILPREKYGELVKENLELSRKMRGTIFEDDPWSLQREQYGELLRENRELSRKMRETIFEDYPRSHQRERDVELLGENLELGREMRETIFEDYPRSHQREKDEELLGENLELSREMRGIHLRDGCLSNSETIFEDYLRSLQGEKYEDLLRENLELNSKLREAAFEDYPRSLQGEKYGELLVENLELSNKLRETTFEDYPRSLQYKKYEQLLKKSIELSRKMRETIFEDYPRSRQRDKFEELLKRNLEMRETIFEDYLWSLQREKSKKLMDEDLEWSTKLEGQVSEPRLVKGIHLRDVFLSNSETTFEDYPRSLQGFEKSRTGSVHAEEEFPKKGMRAGEKRYVIERPRSLKGLESPVTEHPIKKGNVYRKDKGKWISESTPPLAVTTASTESQLEGASTKGGQDLPSQSK